MHTTATAEPSHLSSGLLSAAWRHRWMITLLALVGLAVGSVTIWVRAPRYEATARLLMLDESEGSLFGTVGGSDPYRRMQNAVERLRDDSVLERAAGLADLPLSPGETRRRVDVRVSDVSDTILVTATHGDAASAARLADGVAQSLADALRETAERRVETARAELAPLLEQLQGMIDEGQQALEAVTSPEVRSDIEARRSLALVDLHDMTMTAERLRVDTKLFNGGVASVQPAGVPSAPASAGLLFGGALGFLLGLVAGGLLAWWRAERDPEVAAPTDPELISGMPLLGVLPVPAGRGALGYVTPAAREILGAMRFRVSAEEGSRLFVSAMRPFRGRAHLTVQLAAATAAAGHRVAVVDLGHGSDGSVAACLPHAAGRRVPSAAGGPIPPQRTQVEVAEGGNFLLVRPDLRGEAAGSAAWGQRLAEQLDELVAEGYEVLVHGPTVLEGPESAEVARITDAIVIAVGRRTPVVDLLDGQRRLLSAATPTIGYAYLVPSSQRRLRRTTTLPRRTEAVPERSVA
ncbi:MAG TPA: hypothetical protein VK906_00975 [Egicoccus sp.]|nr:hypothetical protein [Egicoccus sp.]HSK21711.1 hypothetical protein [Egicoccus sp.]